MRANPENFFNLLFLLNFINFTFVTTCDKVVLFTTKWSD